MDVNQILKTLDHNLFHDVAVYDVREKTPFYDSVIIATAPSLTQMEAAIRYLEKDYLIKGIELASEWTLIDLGAVVIHLFSPQDRGKYDLDQILSAYLTMKRA